MVISSVISLMSGVAVFMFGMLLIKEALGEGLCERGGKFLQRFASGRFSALFTGAGVTAALQSSSAVSVLTAAFTDRGILSLYQALWIIVGANLGTTFTGLLTAFTLSEYAPFLCVAGVGLLSCTHKKSIVGAGRFLVGMGLLFVGMNMMESAADGIRKMPVVYDVLMNSSSPLTGLLTGCFFTALIQSSSAVTALLQTMAADRIIGINHAFYIILGANIGTCATCLVASWGLGGAAKRVALMHILYNLCGSLLFVGIAYFIPVGALAQSLFEGEIKMQIGFLNVLFNGVCALIMLALPFSKNTFSAKSGKKQHLQLKYNMVK